MYYEYFPRATLYFTIFWREGRSQEAIGEFVFRPRGLAEGWSHSLTASDLTLFVPYLDLTSVRYDESD